MGSDWTTRSDQPTVLAVFANTPVYGGGMKVAPRALMDDGQLDVCLLARINKLKLFCIFPSVYFGHHLSMSEVDYFQSAHVRVETEHPLDVYADGGAKRDCYDHDDSNDISDGHSYRFAERDVHSRRDPNPQRHSE